MLKKIKLKTGSFNPEQARKWITDSTCRAYPEYPDRRLTDRTLLHLSGLSL